MAPPRRFSHCHLYAGDVHWEASSEGARQAPSLGSSGGSALPVASGAASSPRCLGAPARSWSSTRPGEHLVVRSVRRALLVQRLRGDLLLVRKWHNESALFGSCGVTSSTAAAWRTRPSQSVAAISVKWCFQLFWFWKQQQTLRSLLEAAATGLFSEDFYCQMYAKLTVKYCSW
jgi:hypothetical protein